MNNNDNLKKSETSPQFMPKWITLQLLEKCNLRCKMCYEWGTTGKYHENDQLNQLDLDIVKKIINDCSPAQPYYELFGGEPLLYPWLKEVIEEIKQNGSKVQIITNGVLLKNQSEMLVNSGLDQVWVSVDGPRDINDLQRGRGVYDKALQGIQALDAAKKKYHKETPRIGINCTVTSLNHTYIMETFKQWREWGVLNDLTLQFQTYITDKELFAYEEFLKKEFTSVKCEFAKGMLQNSSDFKEISAVTLNAQLEYIRNQCKDSDIKLKILPDITSEEDITKFFSAKWDEIPKMKKKCMFPWLYTEISATGDVVTCHAFYDFVLGNVYQNDILQIWNNDLYKKFRKKIKKELLPICPACCNYYLQI